MNNLGKATVKVELLSSLPNLTKDRFFFDFDISSDSWNYINYSPYFPPLLSENVASPADGFSAVYPTKRKFFIDNYITGASSKPVANLSNVTSPYILWQPISTKQGLVKFIVNDTPFDSYELLYPGSYPSSGNAYLGPQWEDSAKKQEPPPDDDVVLKEWLASALKLQKKQGGQTPSPATTTADTADTTDTGLIPKINYVFQTVVKEGLWWGIESNDFLRENMPFWVNIKRSSPPSSKKHDNFVIISTGIGDNHDAYDIYLSDNKKPRIIQYYMGRDDTSGENGFPASRSYEFTSDLSKILTSDLELEIGIMTIGGRLILSINKVVQVFTNVISQGSDPQNNPLNAGKLDYFRIAPGRLRIYGSNSQMAINVCPMVFASISCMALPIATVPIQSDEGKNVNPVYRNIKYNNVIGDESVCVLPQSPSVKGKLYGVDCQKFYQIDASGTVSNSPSGQGFHQQGLIYLAPASTWGITGSSAEDFYVLIMRSASADITFSNQNFTIPNAGCPYFFRLKGACKIESVASTPSPTDISQDVLSVSESYQIDDYFIISGSVTITLYNKGGKYDYLRNSQRGIRLYWGWNGNFVQTFTGMITSTASSEKPGSEELTLSCQDYMYILKNYQIMNSPFYDGMVLYYAVQNLARRAGINNIINAWDNTDEYYLPSGYSFTKPSVKFEDTQPLYECIKSMVERAEAVFYFNQFGIGYVKKLPGGLFSQGTGDSGSQFRFTRNPNATGNEHIILDEKNIEYDYSDTVNRIVVTSLERDTRNAIVYTKSANSSEDKLLYRRLTYLEQSALGGYEEAVAYADILSQRAFKTIRKTSFKTTDFNAVIYPLSFIIVDKNEFRLIGLTRTYSAENNDFIMEFNAEWLGI